MKSKVVIGTRGSKLALWQANWVKKKLEELYPDIRVEIEKIKTTGDKILDAPLAKIGGKGLFVKEIEEALLEGRVDIAVHSMKDVPTEMPEGLHISAICRREDPRDAFISREGVSFQDLPEGSIIGTSSLRRTVQLKALRRDIEIKTLRGNVDTRIRKLREGQFDGIVLALAGLKRMGFEEIITETFSEETIIPAIGQGAIGIETRVDDEFINERVKPLNDPLTAVSVSAERAFLAVMGGGCQVPLACHVRVVDGFMKISGMIGDPYKMSQILRETAKIKINPDKPCYSDSSLMDQVKSEAEKLAKTLLLRGGKDILERTYGKL